MIWWYLWYDDYDDMIIWLWYDDYDYDVMLIKKVVELYGYTFERIFNI